MARRSYSHLEALLVHEDGEPCPKRCPYCIITELEAELSLRFTLDEQCTAAVVTYSHEVWKENQRLREAIQAAIDCGMVPSSSAKEGGAARYGRQVEVADMLRAALQGEGEG